MAVTAGTSNLFLSRDTQAYLAQTVTGAVTLTPTTVVISGGSMTVTVTHAFSVGDMIEFSGMDNPLLNTVFKIATVSTTVSFTVLTTIVGTITAANVRLKKVNLWRLKVLNGFAFSQATNTSEVTLSEMQSSTGASRRGSAKFTDSYAPAEWSFSTYVQPILSGGNMRYADEPLMANMACVNTYSGTAWLQGLTLAAGSSVLDFDDSNSAVIGTFSLYFVVGAAKGAADRNFLVDGDTTVYKIVNCVVNGLTINFNVDGIATNEWAGFGGLMSEVGSLNASTATNVTGTDTTNLIRNKLTALSLVSSVSGSSKTYTITLTGGSFAFNNNITFLTPETLGLVNQPIGHVTGARSVSGTFNCYLDEVTLGSKELLNDLVSATTVITNSFAANIFIGGATSSVLNAPGLQIAMAQATLEIPTLQANDVFGLEINFTALPATISGTDEITAMTWKGV